jgi:hypothetical protein
MFLKVNAETIRHTSASVCTVRRRASGRRVIAQRQGKKQHARASRKHNYIKYHNNNHK